MHEKKRSGKALKSTIMIFSSSKKNTWKREKNYSEVFLVISLKTVRALQDELLVGIAILMRENYECQ